MTIELPENLITIDQYAFCYCSKLEELIIPAGINIVGNEAFASCTSLQRVIFLGTPRSMYTNTFKNCTALTDIYVPWSYGAVANAQWGSAATIHYVDEGWMEELL